MRKLDDLTGMAPERDHPSGRRGRDSLGAALLLIGIAAGATGCASTYDSSYRFAPSPAEVRVVIDDDGVEGSLRSLASITGVRRANSDAGTPAAVEARLRVENHSATAAHLRAGEMELIAANLVAFPPPVLVGPDVLEIEPGGWATVDAQFEFPVGEYPGPYDLSGINLQWIIDAGGGATAQSVSFQRLWRNRYPYDGGRWGVGVGYGTHGSGVGVRYGW